VGRASQAEEEADSTITLTLGDHLQKKHDDTPPSSPAVPHPHLKLEMPNFSPPGSKIVSPYPSSPASKDVGITVSHPSLPPPLSPKVFVILVYSINYLLV